MRATLVALSAVAVIALALAWRGASESGAARPGAVVETGRDDRRAEPSGAALAQAERRVAVETAKAASSPETVPVAEPAAEETWAVRARFVDSSGLPLAGVTLSAPEPSEARAESGADGRVRLELDAPLDPRRRASWRLQLGVSGPRHATYALVRTLEGPGEHDLGDVRVMAGGVVTGRVLDAEGRPARSAWVAADQPVDLRAGAALEEARLFGAGTSAFGDGLDCRALTDAEGRFRLPVPALPATIVARSWGHLLTMAPVVHLAPGEERELGDLRLERPRPENLIAGVVLGSGDRPLPGVWVSPEDRQQESVTDDDGRFELIVRERESCVILFSREDPPETRRVTAVAGNLELVVRFEEARWVEVRLTGPEGELLQGGSLWAIGDEGRNLRIATRVREDGALELQVPGEPFRPLVALDGWEVDAPGRFEPEAVPDPLVIRLRRGFGLRGRVLADGLPVAGARIDAHLPYSRCEAGRSDDGFHTRLDHGTGSAATAADGSFFVQLRRPGTYTVHAWTEGRARAELEGVVYSEGADTGELELALTPGATIRGSVLTAEGVSPKGMIVGAGTGDAHVELRTVGDDGGFEFEHLRPGRWQLLECNPQLITRLEGGIYPCDVTGQPVTWTLTLAEGEVSRHGLDLRHRVPGTLHLRVVIGGRPAAGWWASLIDERRVRTQALLDPEGRAALDIAGPGRCTLWLSSSGTDSIRYVLHRPLDCHSGRNDFVVDLPGGTAVLVGLPVLESKERGDHPHYALVWGEDEGLSWSADVLSSSGGELEVGPVPAGEVRVFEGTRGQGGVEPLARIQVAPGGVHRLELP